MALQIGRAIMGKPTKRVTKTIKIHLQMTETRAARLEQMLEIFVKSAKLQPYPYEFLAESKGDYLEIGKQ